MRLRLSNLVAGLSQPTLEQFEDINRRRVETLPFAAAAMAVLLETAQPRQVVFSAFGVREGQMIELLPPALRHQDPLISACESQAERTGRFAMHGQEILDWMTPLFPGETDQQKRLRHATCLINDIGWTEHPDYRAIHSYNRVLRVPYAGLTHPDRAEMALAVLVRYSGDPESRMVAAYRNLLDDQQFARAQIIGMALRLAQTLSGAAPGLLPQTQPRGQEPAAGPGAPERQRHLPQRGGGTPLQAPGAKNGPKTGHRGSVLTIGTRMARRDPPRPPCGR